MHVLRCIYTIAKMNYWPVISQCYHCTYYNCWAWQMPVQTTVVLTEHRNSKTSALIVEVWECRTFFGQLHCLFVTMLSMIIGNWQTSSRYLKDHENSLVTDVYTGSEIHCLPSQSDSNEDHYASWFGTLHMYIVQALQLTHIITALYACVSSSSNILHT